MANTYYDSELTAEEIEKALEAISGVIVPANNGKILVVEDRQIKAKSVQDISGEAVLEPLSVTANGDYYPESEVDGFDEVHVSVPNSYAVSDEGKVVSDGALVAQTPRESQITQNGTYDTTLNNEVTVNVSGGGSAIIQPLSIAQNGIYNPPSGVDGYAPVTVNVPGGGGDTVLLGTTAPTSNIGSNGDYYIKGIYFGDYIENTAEIYFNTGIILNAHDRVEMAARILNKDGGGYRAPFGARKNSMSSNAFGMFAARSGGADAGFFRSGNESFANFDGIRAKDAIFVAQDQILSCTASDGSYLEIRSTGTVNDCVNACFVFNLNSAGQGGASPNGGCYMRLYDFKIYDSSDNLRLHLIPYKDTGNIYCLYDTVSQTVIYANDNSKVTGSIDPAGTKTFAFMETYYKSNGVWQHSKQVST